MLGYEDVYIVCVFACQERCKHERDGPLDPCVAPVLDQICPPRNVSLSSVHRHPRLVGVCRLPLQMVQKCMIDYLISNTILHYHTDLARFFQSDLSQPKLFVCLFLKSQRCFCVFSLNANSLSVSFLSAPTVCLSERPYGSVTR